MKLNQLQVIGRIGQDAKIIDHQSRRFVAFSLAVDDSYKDRNGTKVERTIWYDCVTDQERFFNVTEWLSKGREVFVEGKPSVRTYEKDGQVYGSIRISINNLSLGNDSTRQAATTQTTSTAPTPARAAAPARQAAPVANAFSGEDDNNDLPF